MNFQAACHFAIIRFTPYPETREFVNVGIVLVCAKTGYFGFRLTEHFQRIRAFFPELSPPLISQSLRCFGELLADHCVSEQPQEAFQWSDIPLGSQPMRVLDNLLQLQESLLTCQDPGIILSHNRAETLSELFHHYVERSFAQPRAYQKQLIRSQVSRLLKQHRLSRYFHPGKVGDGTYQVPLDFVSKPRAWHSTEPAFAIQSLDLMRHKDTSKVYEYGDAWLSRVKRLERASLLPKLLFAAALPSQEEALLSAALQVCDELRTNRVLVEPVTNTASIVAFAREVRTSSPLS